MSAQKSNEHDFFSTHPADSKRIAAMKDLINEIENETDFYSKPVIGNASKPKDSSNSTADSVKVCKKCGAKVAIDDQFCTNCGTKFEEEAKCSKCGAPIGEGDAFCMNCGNKI